jgi:hypothetical protein
MQARLVRNTRFVERVVSRWVSRLTHRDVTSALDAWKACVINHKRVTLLGAKMVGLWAHLLVSRAHIVKSPFDTVVGLF